jgi:hypothetical protein
MNVREEMAAPPAAPAGRRPRIPVGSAVRGPDGGAALGIVDKRILSPRTGEVTHLLIRCFGQAPHEVLLPITEVDAADWGVVRLQAPIEQWNRLPARDAAPAATPANPWAAPHD